MAPSWKKYEDALNMWRRLDDSSGKRGAEGARKAVLGGHPVYQHTSTSFVERQNLTMRMSIRQFVRLTNAFLRKAENNEAAMALHFMHYNFALIHQTLRVTPSIEARLAEHERGRV